MSNAMRTRFAPSPTGRLHLGNVRTALFNFLLARATGGSFLLRVEDTDAGRSSEAAADAILEDLRWLGLNWDEGPDTGGSAGPYRQSERSAIYAEYLGRLREEGHAYPCWRTDAELKEYRRRRRAAGRPPVYDRDWARLSEDEVARRERAGQRPVIRFRVPDTGVLESDDCIRGAQHFALADIGDFVVQRSDGSPAFFFSNALDDALMGVTHVLRGEDHLSNTPRQILLLDSLGLPVPVYGHLPLLLGEDGKPLSKRRGSGGMAEFRDEGVFPQALANYAARLGHAFESGELMSLERLADHFALEKVGKAPARYDPVQLQHWQALAVQAAGDTTLAEWAGESALREVPEGLRARFLECVRRNVHRPADVAAWADILFGQGLTISTEIEAVLTDTGPAFFQAALEGLESGGHNLAAVSGAVKQRLGIKGKAVFRPLRLALTGAEAGPELAQMVELLPEETVRSRLGRWA
jgi:nondiscriminating glutamyl-tRNA synthetase